MKKRLIAGLAALLTVAGFTSCSQNSAGFDAAAHEQEILDWRAGRLERLKKPSGYLNQVGLFWLKPGRYRFGAAESNDIVFAGAAAAEVGVFEVTDKGVSMRVAPGVDVRHDGGSVSEMDIPADTSGQSILLTHASLAWSVVERDSKFAIRLRDFDNPFVATFGPLPYFEVDPSLRVRAKLIRYSEPKTANVATVIEGLGYHPESPGVVEFEIEGERYELEAYTSGDELFYVFGDQTNRDATYGAGRFLYSTISGEDGETILDFNKAYSPPCAFNDFSTCPVASPRNRLPIRIEAGEKYDLALHYSTT